MLSSMRLRPRFWAWTLTLTAALLVVVWVVHMRMVTYLRFSATDSMYLSAGAILHSRRDTPMSPAGMALPAQKFYDSGRWRVEWWFKSWTSNTYGITSTTWRIALWPFVLLTGVPGMWMLVKTRKHANPNACPACGYDRTGLPQSSPAPCPECGKSA